MPKHSSNFNRHFLWALPFCLLVYYFISFSLTRYPATSTYNHITLKQFDRILRTSVKTHRNGTDDIRPLCPALPEHSYVTSRSLRQNSSFWSTEDVEFDEKFLAQKFHLTVGGIWGPPTCSPVHHVVIVVPYRDRPVQLKKFLLYMHAFLQLQLISYKILVVEQKDELPFNRGKLFNIGYFESLKEDPFQDCFIFHDVDLLPESIYNIYGCANLPRHMSAIVNTFRYTLLYPELFGGAIAITKDNFHEVNGFSNKYFGWGGEDDDLYNRLKTKEIKILRLSPAISSYRMLVHQKSPASDIRYQLLMEGHNTFDSDGVGNLKFSIVNHIASPLYTLIQVRL